MLTPATMVSSLHSFAGSSVHLLKSAHQSQPTGDVAHSTQEVNPVQSDLASTMAVARRKKENKAGICR